MEDPGQYEAVFLSPDSEYWDPYEESYAINEDSYLNSREGMVYPMPTKTHELILEADVGAVVVDETQSHITKEVNDVIDALITYLAVASCMPNPQDDMMSEDVLKFKAEPIRAQIADVRCTYDPEIFDELVSK